MNNMNIKLLSLTLENFKGFKEFAFVPDGKNASIYGKNEKRKTTIADGYLWLLTGKDSNGDTEFDIKPLDKDNNVKDHGAVTTVEGAFSLGDDDAPLKLRKSLKEKWTKRRGKKSSDKEFDGNITEYYIDDVPVTMTRYNKKINEIVDSETLHLLTDIRYFNEGKNAHWTDRRDMLFVIAGVSDEDILATEDQRAKLRSRRTKIDEKIKELPAREDESLKYIIENPRSMKTIRSVKAGIKEDLNAKEAELLNIEDGSVVDLQRRIVEIETSIINIDNKRVQKVETTRKKQQAAFDKAEKAMCDKRDELAKKKGMLRSLDRDIESLADHLEDLRKQWIEIDEVEFKFQQAICPKCGYDILKAERDEAKAGFYLQKAEDLTAISERGRTKKVELKKLQQDKMDIENQIDLIGSELINLESAFDNAKAELENIKIDVSPKRQKLLDEKQNIESQIEEIRIGNRDATGDIKEDIKKLQEELEALDTEIALLEASKKAQKRIKELEKEHQRLSAEHENIEAELSQLDNDVREQTTSLNEKIMGKFNYVSFKFFKEQNNGELVPCCVSMREGVPYPGCSNSQRIKIGIDIRNAIAEHFGVNMPYFVDNAESSNKLLPSDAQHFRLVVTPDDKELRVEIDNEAQEAA